MDSFERNTNRHKLNHREKKLDRNSKRNEDLIKTKWKKNQWIFAFHCVFSNKLSAYGIFFVTLIARNSVFLFDSICIPKYRYKRVPRSAFILTDTLLSIANGLVVFFSSFFFYTIFVWIFSTRGTTIWHIHMKLQREKKKSERYRTISVICLKDSVACNCLSSTYMIMHSIYIYGLDSFNFFSSFLAHWFPFILVSHLLFDEFLRDFCQ